MTKLLVIGASTGGVSALRALLPKLPPEFDIPIALVLHIGERISVLPSLLNGPGKRRAMFAQNGDVLKPGHVYIAPPDHHMLVIGDHLELTRGPRENWSRPAIDPLFRSAAESYGRHCAGLVLTGNLNDGTAGLYEIKRRGGKTLVQDPADAEMPGMPRSAAENVEIDWCLPLRTIPERLIRLAEEEKGDAARPSNKGEEAMTEGIDRLMEPVAFSCPDCGGAMRAEKIGKMTRFVCHIGHSMTDKVLSAQQIDGLEYKIESAVRALNEHAALCADMAAKTEAAGNKPLAKTWQAAEMQARQRLATMMQIGEQEWLHPEDA